jgi:hypothetical protein
MDLNILVAGSGYGPHAYFCDYGDDNLGISWSAEQLSAAKERPYTIKLVSILGLRTEFTIINVKLFL